jgi:hypothetical protein
LALHLVPHPQNVAHGSRATRADLRLPSFRSRVAGSGDPWPKLTSQVMQSYPSYVC